MYNIPYNTEFWWFNLRQNLVDNILVNLCIIIAYSLCSTQQVGKNILVNAADFAKSIKIWYHAVAIGQSLAVLLLHMTQRKRC